MNQFIHLKTAIAATCLALGAGMASAQDSRTPSNTTSPDPLQVNPVDGTPNSGTGKMTPGTGTGSSRTMRNDNSVNVDPANTNRSTGSTDSQMTNPSTSPSGSSTTDSYQNRGATTSPGGSSSTDSYPNRGTTRSGSGSMNNNSSGSDSMNNMEPSGAGMGSRAARRDRG